MTPQQGQTLCLLLSLFGFVAPATSTTITTATTPTSAATSSSTVTTLPTTMPTTTPPPTTTTVPLEDCLDKDGANCWSRPDEDCFGIYEPWAQVNCPRRCGFCPDRTPPCEDAIDYCDSFDAVACNNDRYRQWARVNCRKFCNLCTVPTRPAANQSAHWTNSSPADGAVKYACAGGRITLPWNYVISTGVTVGDIQWFYEGHGRPKELVGLTTHGHFLALPSFGDRVTAEGNAGISVSRMKVGDSGNYSVEVHLYGDVMAGAHTVLRRSVFVQISDDLMTQDGYLHVSQRPEAILDTQTDQWTIELQCGTFTFRGDPAFQVEWITPSGQSLSSSDFSDNHFNLRLNNPVQGGNYTCRIPPQQVANTCLNGNGEHKGEASIHVETMDARFTLLEKEKNELKAANAKLQQRLNTLEQGQVSRIDTRLQRLEETTQHQVAFHATQLQDPAPADGAPLIVTDVHYNNPSAYDSNSGYFTVPYTGTYFVIATTVAVNNLTTVERHVSLYVDDGAVSDVRVSDDVDDSVGGVGAGVGDGHLSATVHGVLRLSAGQRVWVRGDGREYYGPSTTFSGFLVAP